MLNIYNGSWVGALAPALGWSWRVSMRIIKGGWFEGRELHKYTQPGGPLALGTDAGIEVKFRPSNVSSFGRLWGRRGAPEGTLKRPECTECRYKSQPECLLGAFVGKNLIMGSPCRSPDRQSHGFTTVKQ